MGGATDPHCPHATEHSSAWCGSASHEMHGNISWLWQLGTTSEESEAKSKRATTSATGTQVDRPTHDGRSKRAGAWLVRTWRTYRSQCRTTRRRRHSYTQATREGEQHNRGVATVRSDPPRAGQQREVVVALDKVCALSSSYHFLTLTRLGLSGSEASSAPSPPPPDAPSPEPAAGAPDEDDELAGAAAAAAGAGAAAASAEVSLMAAATTDGGDTSEDCTTESNIRSSRRPKTRASQNKHERDSGGDDDTMGTPGTEGWTK